MGLLQAGQKLRHTEGIRSAAGTVPASRECSGRAQLQPEDNRTVTNDTLATMGPQAHVPKLNERKEKASDAEPGHSRTPQQMENNHGLI